MLFFGFVTSSCSYSRLGTGEVEKKGLSESTESSLIRLPAKTSGSESPSWVGILDNRGKCPLVDEEDLDEYIAELEKAGGDTKTVKPSEETEVCQEDAIYATVIPKSNRIYYGSLRRKPSLRFAPNLPRDDQHLGDLPSKPAEETAERKTPERKLSHTSASSLQEQHDWQSPPGDVKKLTTELDRLSEQITTQMTSQSKTSSGSSTCSSIITPGARGYQYYTTPIVRERDEGYSSFSSSIVPLAQYRIAESNPKKPYENYVQYEPETDRWDHGAHYQNKSFISNDKQRCTEECHFRTYSRSIRSITTVHWKTHHYPWQLHRHIDGFIGAEFWPCQELKECDQKIEICDKCFHTIHHSFDKIGETLQGASELRNLPRFPARNFLGTTKDGVDYFHLLVVKDTHDKYFIERDRGTLLIHPTWYDVACDRYQSVNLDRRLDSIYSICNHEINFELVKTE